MLSARQFASSSLASDAERESRTSALLAEGEIRAITLQPKAISQGGNIWIPQVDLIDGTNIWITSFECGPAARPPKLERVATVDELRKLLRVQSG